MIARFFLLFAMLILPRLALAEDLAEKVQVFQSPGGQVIWLMEDHSLPFIALELRFEGGTSLDAPGKRGAVNLMAALLEEGAGGRDAQGFAEARDGLGAEFAFEAGPDAVAISARMLSENRKDAVALLAEALGRPRFDAVAVERVRGQVQSVLRNAEKDPQDLAARAFDAAAFGSDPYASAGEGSAESVAALTVDDLRAAHQGALARDRAFVAVAGDIDAAALGPLVDALLAGLPAQGAPLSPPAPVTLKAGVAITAFPGGQSFVHFGQKGLPRQDPDFFAAFVLNEILGGERFDTRLMTALREERGLTYGVRTSLVPLARAALWEGGFVSDNAKVAEAVALLQSEWARVLTEGVSAEELAAAKAYLIGSYPLRFSGNRALAAILAEMQLDGLDPDYIATRNEKIAAVTGADLARVAGRLMGEGLYFSVVGAPEGLAPAP